MKTEDKMPDFDSEPVEEPTKKIKNKMDKTRIQMQFDPNVAKEIGVEEAIMLANIEFWQVRNEANNKTETHFHGDCWWTYNSANAFAVLFPFWTEKQIRRILDNLINKGYIKTGIFNKMKYDRTRWFTSTRMGNSSS